MDILKKYFSKGSFLVILLCFLLPFAVVKCNGQEIAAVKGTDLIYGGEITVDMPNFQKMVNTSAEEGIDIKTDTEQKTQNAKRNKWIILVFLLSIIGFVLSFIRKEDKKTLATLFAISVIAIVLLIVFVINAKVGGAGLEGVPADMGKMLSIELAKGFYLIFLLFVINIVYFGYNSHIFDKYINREEVEKTINDIQNKAEDMYEDGKEKLKDVKEDIEEGYEKVKDKTDDIVEKGKEKAKDGVEAVKKSTKDVVDDVKETADNTAKK